MLVRIEPRIDPMQRRVVSVLAVAVLLVAAARSPGQCTPPFALTTPNPNTGQASGQLLALAVDLQRNTTPNLIDARSGYLLQVHAEQAGRWMPGDFNYVEYTAEARKYQTIGNVVLRAPKPGEAKFPAGASACAEVDVPAKATFDGLAESASFTNADADVITSPTPRFLFDSIENIRLMPLTPLLVHNIGGPNTVKPLESESIPQ